MSNQTMSVPLPTLPEKVAEFITACKQYTENGGVSLSTALTKDSVIPVGHLSVNDRQQVRSWLSMNKTNQETFALAWVTDMWELDTTTQYTIPVTLMKTKKGEQLYLTRRDNHYYLKTLEPNDVSFLFSEKERINLPKAYQDMAVLYQDAKEPEGVTQAVVDSDWVF